MRPPRLRPRPSQPLAPRPGRDTPPAPPLAARGNTLTFPPPLIHPPGHPSVLPTPDSGNSCRATQLPRPHPCSTPSATLSSPRPASSAAPSRGPGGPQPLLWQRRLVPDARLGALGGRQRLRARTRAPRTHADTQHNKHTLTHAELTHARHVTTNADTQHTSDQPSSHTDKPHKSPAMHSQHTDPHSQQMRTAKHRRLPKHRRGNTHNQPTQTPNHAKPTRAAHRVHTTPTHVLSQAPTARRHPASRERPQHF